MFRSSTVRPPSSIRSRRVAFGSSVSWRAPPRQPKTSMSAGCVMSPFGWIPYVSIESLGGSFRRHSVSPPVETPPWVRCATGVPSKRWMSLATTYGVEIGSRPDGPRSADVCPIGPETLYGRSETTFVIRWFQNVSW